MHSSVSSRGGVEEGKGRWVKYLDASCLPGSDIAAAEPKLRSPLTPKALLHIDKPVLSEPPEFGINRQDECPDEEGAKEPMGGQLVSRNEKSADACGRMDDFEGNHSEGRDSDSDSARCLSWT